MRDGFDLYRFSEDSRCIPAVDAVDQCSRESAFFSVKDSDSQSAAVFLHRYMSESSGAGRKVEWYTGHGYSKR